jgi:hypothetical protein
VSDTTTPKFEARFQNLRFLLIDGYPVAPLRIDASPVVRLSGGSKQSLP